MNTDDRSTPHAPRPTLDIVALRKRLPHRFPFLMIDRVLELEPGKRGVAIKNVTVNEPHFQGHFPDDPIMPGVLILEAMAQLGGLVTDHSREDSATPRVGFLAAIDKARFRRAVRPGDQLRLEVEALAVRRSLGKVRGVATVDGQTAAEAEILFVMEETAED